MLQPPSHMSKVCGHGHIKKFWLMQTQKENQACDSSFVASPPSPEASLVRGFGSSSALPRLATSCSYGQTCENKGSAFVSSPSSSSDGNRGSLRVFEPYCTATCGYASSDAGFDKHSTVTCATPSSPGLSPGFLKEEAASQRISREGAEDLDCFSDASGFNRSYPSFPSPGPASDPDSGVDPIKTCDLRPFSSDCHRNNPSIRNREPPSAEPLCKATDYVSQVAVDDHLECYQRINGTSDRGFRELKEESSDGNMPSLVRKLGTRVSAADDKPAVEQPEDSKLPCSPSAEGGSQPVLKACTLCGTTKTPMWRSGPQGPKSLCNACGIRFKKYRALPGTTESSEGSGHSKYHARPSKRKLQNGLLVTEAHVHEAATKPLSDDSRYQKKSKWHQLMMKRNQADVFEDNSSAWKVSSGPASLKKIYGCMQSRFKNLGPITEHLTVNRVFAKDEEDAAVLLMHLSCGLAC